MSPIERLAKRVASGLRMTPPSPVSAFLRPVYDLALRGIYGRRGLPRRIHGEEPIRLNPRYRAQAEEQEPLMFATLRQLVRPHTCVFDIGANIGVYSLLMGRWVGSGGRVFAFEPAPESLKALTYHVALNGQAERIEVVGAAVSDLPGQATFYAASYNGENSLNAAFGSRVPSARHVSVPVTTIDEFCDAHGVVPALIKMDIEGYEFHALRGAMQTLRKHRPTLVVELHPGAWSEIGMDHPNRFAVIEELGYRVEPLGEKVTAETAKHVVIRPIDL